MQSTPERKLVAIYPNWIDGVPGLLTGDDCNDLITMAEYAGQAAGDYVEIGSFKGCSSINIARGMPPDRKLHCFDWFEDDKYGEFLKNIEDHVGLDRVIPYKGDYHETFATAGLSKLAFAFIDHDHTYESTKGAIELLWPMIEPSGVMMLHDYKHGEFPGCTQAIDEFAVDHKDNIIRTLMATFFK